MTFPENDVKTIIHLKNHDFHFPRSLNSFSHCDTCLVLWGGASIDLKPNRSNVDLIISIFQTVEIMSPEELHDLQEAY